MRVSVAISNDHQALSTIWKALGIANTAFFSGGNLIRLQHICRCPQGCILNYTDHFLKLYHTGRFYKTPDYVRWQCFLTIYLHANHGMVQFGEREWFRKKLWKWIVWVGTQIAVHKSDPPPDLYNFTFPSLLKKHSVLYFRCQYIVKCINSGESIPVETKY